MLTAAGESCSTRAVHRATARSDTRERGKLAAGVDAESIAFPAISTGVYGYPIDQATRIALRTVASHLEVSALPARVVFCCFSAEDADVYEHVAAECLSR